MAMKWKLMWTLDANGAAIRNNERGLHNLQSCKDKLLDICRQATVDGFTLLDACAMPEMAGGTIRLLGAPMGAVRCGVL